MKTILTTIMLLFLVTSCSSFGGVDTKDKKPTQQTEQKSTGRTLLARLTAYWPGQDKWTTRGQTSTGAKLEHKKTAAVDPRVIPYGTKIKIPSNGLSLIAADTGSAVKSRRASRRNGRNEPVIDIFFKSKYEAKKFLNSLDSDIVEVLLTKN